MRIQPGMIKDADHPLNKTPFSHTYPEPLCDLRPFQAALNRIFGVEGSTGRPWVRVIWAQDQGNDPFGPISKDWDAYGKGGRGEWRQRYVYASAREFIPEIDQETGIISHVESWTDLSPPRFVLESFIPPQMACMGWADPGFGGNKTIFGTYYDAAGDRFTPIKPRAGLYQPLPISHMPHILGGVIADHDRECCLAAEVSDRVCYGYYTEPAAAHLAVMLKLADQILNQNKERRPGLMTEAEAEAVKRRTRENNARYWGEYQARMKQMALEACRTHEGMLSESDKKNRHGKYNPVSGAARSGASAEQIKQWKEEKAVIWKP